MSELAGSKKKGKNKKKGMEDNVNEAGVDSASKDDCSQPQKKKRRQKDKDKNKQDDLGEGTLTGSAGGPSKSKKRKKKTEDTDQGQVTTNNQQTDFGTNVPTTQKDLL